MVRRAGQNLGPTREGEKEAPRRVRSEKVQLPEQLLLSALPMSAGGKMGTLSLGTKRPRFQDACQVALSNKPTSLSLAACEQC